MEWGIAGIYELWHFGSNGRMSIVRRRISVASCGARAPLDFQLFNFSGHFRAAFTMTLDSMRLPIQKVYTGLHSFVKVYCMNFIIFLCVAFKLFSISFAPLLGRTKSWQRHYIARLLPKNWRRAVLAIIVSQVCCNENESLDLLERYRQTDGQTDDLAGIKKLMFFALPYDIFLVFFEVGLCPNFAPISDKSYACCDNVLVLTSLYGLWKNI